jgi:hypothetical protein
MTYKIIRNRYITNQYPKGKVITLDLDGVQKCYGHFGEGLCDECPAFESCKMLRCMIEE